jgi:pyridoxine kinase
MKSIAAIHDLSCHAKSSLTVVVPTLAAVGVEASILPTALLSTQTDGYIGYHYQDLTDTMKAIIAHWEALDLKFDAVYSGFLGSQLQVDIVTEFMNYQKTVNNSHLLVDPVLGDDGTPYSPITDELITKMHSLVAICDTTTPNLTEAALLLGKPYPSTIDLDIASQWAKSISQIGPKEVVITGVPQDDGGTTICYCKDEDTIHYYHNVYAPVTYPGSGDLFASILCALIVKGRSFSEAVKLGSSLTSTAIYRSWQQGIPRREGVAVELIMEELVGVSK